MSVRWWHSILAVVVIVSVGVVRAEEKSAGSAKESDKPSEKPILGVDRSYMDPSLSPCKDFYDYCNGAFNKVPIPGEYAAFGVNQEINERNFAILKQILEESARSGGPKGSVVQRVGDFYASGMDEAAVDRAGTRPLEPWLERIAAIATTKDLIKVLAQLQVQGLNVGIHFDVQIDDKDTTTMISGFSQGGLGLPERDYYFREGKDAEETRAAYVAHIARMLELAGDSAAAAKATADSIMAFETKLAKASRTIVDLRDPEKNYNKYERTGAHKTGPRTRLGRLLRYDRVSRCGNEAAHSPAGISHRIQWPRDLGASENLARLSTLASHLRNGRLPEQAVCRGALRVLREEAFRGYRSCGRAGKRVMTAVDASIGEDLGQLYVQRAFSAAAKARALALVNFHKDAMRARVRASQWMSQSTKDSAYKKLDTMRQQDRLPGQMGAI